MLTTRRGVRALSGADLGSFLELAQQDPVANVFVIHRAQTTNLEPRWLGGEMWGRFEDGELVAADSSEVDDSYALFTDALAAAGNPRRAWKLTLIGMLSDFRSLFY